MKKHLLFALMCLMGITSVQKAYAVKQIYARLNGNTMTLYYDEHKEDFPDDPLYGWSDKYGTLYIEEDTVVLNQISVVRLSPSMQEARPTSMATWFGSLTNLVVINNLEYLNTSEVTRMDYMFAYCSSLRSLDLSSFNTVNVESMKSTFERCSGLTSLNLSSFNTSNLKEMDMMFAYCSSLTELDLTSFNSIENLINLDWLFYSCTNLKTIFCNAIWGNHSYTFAPMGIFKYCTSLVGGNGTAFDANFEDITYARPDKPGQPGYFTMKGDYTEENGWLYYDDGNAVTPFGPGSGTFHWAVMYPANTVNSTSLDQIGVFVSGYNTDPISISIREGGKTPKEATEIATTSFSPSQSRGMETVSLSPAVTFDNTMNLWIVLSAPAGYPAVVCANTGDPNSRWYSMNGTTWGDLATTSSGGVKNDYSFMIRAHFNDLHEDIEDITPSNSPSRGEKILRDGKLYIVVGDKTYDARGNEVR